MSYGIFPAGQAARQPDRPEVLGYLFNNGGLSNQKMALAGLFLTGLAKRLTINLPYIHVMDHHATTEHLVRFEDVFEPAPFCSFGRSLGLGIELVLPSGEAGGWAYFMTFSEVLTRRDQPGAIRCALLALAALRPRLVATAPFRNLCATLFDVLEISSVVQMRIEQDWQPHADGMLEEGADKDIAIGFEEILHRTANTFPDLRAAYVTADEAFMPVSKEIIRTFARQRHGIRLIWKSDLLDTAGLTPLDLSLIDFEVARRAKRFIGVSYSSFANLLCLEQFAAQGQPVANHFIYNHPGNVVRQRCDNGFAMPAADVVVPHWSGRLWMQDGNRPHHGPPEGVSPGVASPGVVSPGRISPGAL